MTFAEGQKRRRRLFTEPVILHIGGRQTIGYAFYELEGGLGITIAKGKFSIADGDPISVRVGGELRAARVVKVVEFPEGYSVDVTWIEVAAGSAPAESLV
jgi:hypothetical protein